MVRLKGYSLYIEILEYNEFQFLMVRLKAQLLQALVLDNQISIPYGAIKSRSRGFRACSNFKISIPYGAIKSYTY